MWASTLHLPGCGIRELQVAMIDLIMTKSVRLALFACIAWGWWAFFTKLATRSAQPVTVLVISYLTASIVGLGYFLLSTTELSTDESGVIFSVAGGIATGIGSVLYYTSLKYGDISVASTIVGLYFVVATLLGVILLHESVTASKILGIGLATIAVVLLTH